MNSIILQLAAKYLKPLFIIFSVFVLLRGHNAPGGGFIGGLLAASGILFYAFAHGTDKLFSSYLKPRSFLILGIILIFTSGVAGFLKFKPVFTGLWTEIDVGLMQLKLGTPLLFDTGVYFIVLGSLLTITMSIIEELEWK